MLNSYKQATLPELEKELAMRMQERFEAFKARLAISTLANQERRNASWAKRDAYFAAKDKLVADMKAQGFKHTHGDCSICNAIAELIVVEVA
jgi:3-methyladenine DNA glycosylase Tag